MPEVAICTGNVVIPDLGARILFKWERLKYSPEYLVQHLSVRLPLLIMLILRNIGVLDGNRQKSDHYDIVH